MTNSTEPLFRPIQVHPKHRKGAVSSSSSGIHERLKPRRTSPQLSETENNKGSSVLFVHPDLPPVERARRKQHRKQQNNAMKNLYSLPLQYTEPESLYFTPPSIYAQGYHSLPPCPQHPYVQPAYMYYIPPMGNQEVTIFMT